MTGAVAAPDLRTLIADYLATRRALGFKLEAAEHLLLAFADHLDGSSTDDSAGDGAGLVTIEQALRFGTANAGSSRRSHALRLSAIRLFARWAQLLDPQIQVPPARLLAARATRPRSGGIRIFTVWSACGRLRRPDASLAGRRAIVGDWSPMQDRLLDRPGYALRRVARRRSTSQPESRWSR